MKVTVISIIIALGVIGASVFLVKNNATQGSASAKKDNVQVIDGKQVIEITARGGYWPRISNAKAGMPTTLKLTTAGAFDCSIAVRIPSLGYRANLPMTGTTNVDIPPQKAGTQMQGLCAMGMYNFVINFN